MRPLMFENSTLKLLDQTRLPTEIQWVSCATYEQVADAIRNMVVRGAPVIGVTAAYGMAIGAMGCADLDRDALSHKLDAIGNCLFETRPTAVNLHWALERMKRVYTGSERPTHEIVRLLLNEAIAIDQEDIQANRAMGKIGAEVVPDGVSILTHCNAGALATADYGTALGVMRAAHEQGKHIHVYADETRPYLQGSRLTAWELMQSGIPVTLICDNMAGYLMQQGKIGLVITGADRIASNGDTANKIGTYSVAVLAKHHGIPFYIAAPYSTIDKSLATGKDIPIEERSPDEVTHFRGIQIAPEGVHVYNPSFDVTPGELIAGIITEKGILRPPYAIGQPHAPNPCE